MSDDPRQFLYRPGMLDRDGAQVLAARHLAACDDGELFLEYSANEAFGFDDGRLKTASYDTSSGFGLRAVSGEMTAFAHSNEMTPAAIRRAAETMALIEPSVAAKAGHVAADFREEAGGRVTRVVQRAVGDRAADRRSQPCSRGFLDRERGFAVGHTSCTADYGI